MAASVAASVIIAVLVIPLGVPPIKTKAMKIFIPQGGEILRKIKRGRNILGGRRFRIIHIGYTQPAICGPFTARLYWPKLIYNKSTYTIRRVDGRILGRHILRKNA